MAVVNITMKLMGDSPDADLNAIKETATKEITDFGGSVAGTEEEPVAFGLKALLISFSMQEDKGATDPLEESLEKINGVQSVQVTSVSRALG